MNERDGARIVNGRHGVGHANHRRKATPGRGGSAGRDGLFRGLTRLAPMHVQVNQAGANDEAVGIKGFNPGRRLLSGIGANGGNLSAQDQQISNGIEVFGGVYDSPAGEKQRVHRAPSLATAN